jgi:hypothetical protein
MKIVSKETLWSEILLRCLFHYFLLLVDRFPPYLLLLVWYGTIPGVRSASILILRVSCSLTSVFHHTSHQIYYLPSGSIKAFTVNNLHTLYAVNHYYHPTLLHVGFQTVRKT